MFRMKLEIFALRLPLWIDRNDCYGLLWTHFAANNFQSSALSINNIKWRNSSYCCFFISLDSVARSTVSDPLTAQK